MQLCLSTLMWPDRSLSEALAAARATGITALDLAATPACPHLHPLPGLPPALELRPLLAGWQLLALTADHPDLARAEGEGGEEAVRWTVAAVKAAEAPGGTG